MTPLCELAQKYGTDKLNRYTPIYFDELGGKRDKVKLMLEIGIHQGRSLRMWRDFFPNAEIRGVDFNPYWVEQMWMCGSPRIVAFKADQTSKNQLLEAVPAGKMFDFIVDDGSHNWQRQLAAANTLLPHLAEDGLYVIEDVKRDNGVEDPGGIMKKIPRCYASRLTRVGKHDGDAMISIRWCASC